LKARCTNFEDSYNVDFGNIPFVEIVRRRALISLLFTISLLRLSSLKDNNFLKLVGIAVFYVYAMMIKVYPQSVD